MEEHGFVKQATYSFSHFVGHGNDFSIPVHKCRQIFVQQEVQVCDDSWSGCPANAEITVLDFNLAKQVCTILTCSVRQCRASLCSSSAAVDERKDLKLVSSMPVFACAKIMSCILPARSIPLDKHPPHTSIGFQRGFAKVSNRSNTGGYSAIASTNHADRRNVCATCSSRCHVQQLLGLGY
eukprot:1138521-Pelagomonas_calceolata.AAC.2